MVSGMQIKPPDGRCCIATYIPAMFLLFPICLTCCGWWKRKVLPFFSIPPETYESLHRLVRNYNLRNLTLNIIDNTFDGERAQQVYNMVSGSNLRGLTLINTAATIDVRNKEYSCFERNVLPLKELKNVIVDVRWQSRSKIGYNMIEMRQYKPEWKWYRPV